MNMVDKVETEWAPLDHPIFKLVPELFRERIDGYLQELGNPVVNADTFWIVYVSILGQFVSLDDRQVLDPTIQNAVSEHGRLCSHPTLHRMHSVCCFSSKVQV